ncbi:MAG: manganese catalase family protein [Chloroflexota bacterium]|nr:manganese catalase family protein [Chloroflexota bacterium]
MFFHVKEMQFDAKPDRPDPLYARRLQELVGGKFGEMTVMMSYLFQGWNCRGPQKYRDMLLDIGTEEIAHVEMLSVMISRLLDGAPISAQEDAAKNPVVGAALGGGAPRDVIYAAMNPQHEIVSGGGAEAKDSMGIPWSGAFQTCSGNLLADFRWNLMAESQGNLQVSRLYEMTEDAGVRRMLSFNLARDIMHQNQWGAAIEELQADGLHDFIVPDNFPLDRVMLSQAYTFWNCSQGTESGEGRWAQGKTPDGKGEFVYLDNPAPLSSDTGSLQPGDPHLHGTPPKPMPPTSPGGPNPVSDQKVPSNVDKKAVTSG